MEVYLPLLGILFQYARASKRVPDWGVVLVMIGATVGAHWLSGGVLNTRESWGIAGVLGSFLKVVGVAGVTSMTANTVVSFGANPEHPAVPVTSSK